MYFNIKYQNLLTNFTIQEHAIWFDDVGISKLKNGVKGMQLYNPQALIDPFLIERTPFTLSNK